MLENISRTAFLLCRAVFTRFLRMDLEAFFTHEKNEMY